MNKLIIQMDEPESFDPTKDSTLALAIEAQARGMEIFYYTPSQIAAVNGKIQARVRPIEFYEEQEEFFKRGDFFVMDLEKADTILIRQNPPYNMQYLGCTWLLEQLQHPKIWNHPAAIRNRPEKLFPLEFPEFIPPSCISADMNRLKAFRAEQGDVVMKPLYGFGGDSIYLVKATEASFTAKVMELKGEENLPIILQRYLPEVLTEDKRIVLIDGEIVASFNRRPAKGEFRTNMAIGGSAHKTELSERQTEIAQKVGGVCKEEGLLFVGLDVIGDHLIEINTTCPTGILAVKRLYDIDIAKIFWDVAQTC